MTMNLSFHVGYISVRSFGNCGTKDIISLHWMKLSLMVGAKLILMHSVENSGIYSQLFDQNFVKATYSTKKQLKSWFHEICYFWQEKISCFPTICTMYTQCKIHFTHFLQDLFEIISKLHCKLFPESKWK